MKFTSAYNSERTLLEKIVHTIVHILTDRQIGIPMLINDDLNDKLTSQCVKSK